MRDTALRGATARLFVAAGLASYQTSIVGGSVLRVRNIACVVSNMTNSDELPTPGITAKKTLELKALHRSKLAREHA